MRSKGYCCKSNYTHPEKVNQKKSIVRAYTGHQIWPVELRLAVVVMGTFHAMLSYLHFFMRGISSDGLSIEIWHMSIMHSDLECFPYENKIQQNTFK